MPRPARSTRPPCNGGNVTLTRVSDGKVVVGEGATSGGSDTVSFLPAAPLDGGTLYRFTITAGAKDRAAARSCRSRPSSPPAVRPGRYRRRPVRCRLRHQGLGCLDRQELHLAGHRPGWKALRRQHLRPDLPLDDQRRRHTVRRVRDQHGANPRERQELGGRPQPHRHRDGVRSGLHGDQPDPLDHRRLRLSRRGRAGRQWCHLPADRRESGELRGDRGQPAAFDQGPRDELRRLARRKAVRHPGLDERHGRHRRHLEARRAPAVRRRARARSGQAAGRAAGRRGHSGRQRTDPRRRARVTRRPTVRTPRAPR